MADSEEVPGFHLILSDINDFIDTWKRSHYQNATVSAGQPLSPLIGCMMERTCP